MKSYILDIIPKIQSYSKQLDDLSLLTNQHWVLFESIGSSKITYIFKTDGQLLLSRNGKVSKGRWEYLSNNSILIDIDNESLLYKQGFFDKDVLALKIDNSDKYSLLLNENNVNGELGSVRELTEFLTSKYLESNNEISRPSSTKENELRNPQFDVEKEIPIFEKIVKKIGLTLFFIFGGIGLLLIIFNNYAFARIDSYLKILAILATVSLVVGLKFKIRE